MECSEWSIHFILHTKDNVIYKTPKLKGIEKKKISLSDAGKDQWQVLFSFETEGNDAIKLDKKIVGMNINMKVNNVCLFSIKVNDSILERHCNNIIQQIPNRHVVKTVTMESYLLINKQEKTNILESVTFHSNYLDTQLIFNTNISNIVSK